MTASSVSSLLLLCLLVLPAQHAAASTLASYKPGSRKTFFKTPAGRSSTGPRTTTNILCKSFTGGGLGNNNLLPVVRRRSPWSTVSDLLRRDTSRIRHLFSSQSSMVAAPAPAPSPAATTIPANSSSDSMRLGKMDYSVLVSYGTPEQQFPVLLDTNSIGVSLLRCKPCASGSENCDPAFDTSRSTTFAYVLCGSPDCPANCSSGSVCPFDNPYIRGSYAEDVLTLAPSMAVHDIRFVCLDVDKPSDVLPTAGGILDLSRSRNSLPSRLGGASPATFSYCLPHAPSSRGFLSFGGDANNLPRNDINLTAVAPMVSRGDPELSGMYFIDLVGISLGGEDLPIPTGTFGGNTSVNIDVGTTFTMLAPDAYAVLRDAFRKEMSQYNRSVPGFAGFDTCFNFTGIVELDVPFVQFKFSNGESLQIEDQMMYYEDPSTGPWGMTCLAFSSLSTGGDVLSAVIGTYTLGSTEVVYDVAGGKVGFVPYCC